MRVGSGQCTNAMPKKLNHFHLRCLKKTPEEQLTSQDAGYRSPEESRDVKPAYSIEACAVVMDWPCYKNYVFHLQQSVESQYCHNQPSKSTPTHVSSNTSLSETKNAICPSQQIETSDTYIHPTFVNIRVWSLLSHQPKYMMPLVRNTK